MLQPMAPSLARADPAPAIDTRTGSSSSLRAEAPPAAPAPPIPPHPPLPIHAHVHPRPPGPRLRPDSQAKPGGGADMALVVIKLAALVDGAFAQDAADADVDAQCAGLRAAVQRAMQGRGADGARIAPAAAAQRSARADDVRRDAAYDVPGVGAASVIASWACQTEAAGTSGEGSLRERESSLNAVDWTLRHSPLAFKARKDGGADRRASALGFL